MPALLASGSARSLVECRVEELPIETTVYSMSAAPPVEQNRREGVRHLTLFRVGTIIVGGRRELCLVKNLSAGGALVRAYCELRPDLAIDIELKERQPIAGRVSWVRGSDAGLAFDQAIDVLALLKASSGGPRPRMPRMEVKSVGFIREGAIVHRVSLFNISQGGLSVESANPLTIGGEVIVSLPGLPAQGAVVKWREANRYGITFNNVLALAALVEWLHSRSG